MGTFSVIWEVSCLGLISFCCILQPFWYEGGRIKIIGHDHLILGEFYWGLISLVLGTGGHFVSVRFLRSCFYYHYYCFRRCF